MGASVAHGQGSPGVDQYVPSVPGATSGKSKNKSTQAQSNQSSSGSADDQALAQITGDGSKSSKKSGSNKAGKNGGGEGGNDSSKAIPVAGSGGGGGDDDGAVGSVASALTDWNDPLLPGLVALAALFTLGAAVIALVRRRRI